MDTESSPTVATCRRKSTTVLGVVLVTIAVVCLIGSVFVVTVFGFNFGSDPGYRTAMVVHQVLLVFSKVALLVLGICLLRRYRHIRTVAARSFSISFVDSVQYLFVVTPYMRARMPPGWVGLADFGAWFVLAVSALMYIGILVYLSQPASRQEFGSNVYYSAL